MNHHLSRRELVRRMTQGREAIRLLSAIVIEHGGVLRVERDRYLHQAPTARLEVHQDALTGTFTLKASNYGETTQPAATPPGRTTTHLRDDAVVQHRREEDGDAQKEVPETGELQS